MGATATILFAGPTLAGIEPAFSVDGQGPKALAGELAALDVQVHGPVRCGDVYRAVCDGFRRVAIIDGVFDQSLSVWHKEILWALHRGCCVYGAASMGALRAAELHPFGMVGVGRIFEAFRDELLLADDEVAVAHGGAEDAYRPHSEALVNMRVTLQSAVGAGVLPRDRAEAFVALAQARFYPERTWAQLLADGERTEGLSGHVSGLRGWLAGDGGRVVNQKALDARALVQRLATDGRQVVETARADVGEHPAGCASGVAFAFAYTESFHELVKRHRLSSPSATLTVGRDGEDD